MRIVVTATRSREKVCKQTASYKLAYTQGGALHAIGFRFCVSDLHASKVQLFQLFVMKKMGHVRAETLAFPGSQSDNRSCA